MKGIEDSKAKSLYDRYNDEDVNMVDPTNPTEKLLPQYNERKEEKHFVIGENSEETKRTEQEEIRAKLRQKSKELYSLESSKQVAQDFLTTAEVAAFRKPKATKKKKVLRKTVKQEISEQEPQLQLQPQPQPQGSFSIDHGSREAREKARELLSNPELLERQERELAYQKAVEKANETAKYLQTGLSVSAKDEVYEDDVSDLYESMARCRKEAAKKRVDSEAEIAARITTELKFKEEPKEAQDDLDATNGMVLTQISEFCRILPSATASPPPEEVPVKKEPEVKIEPDEEPMQIEREPQPPQQGVWKPVDENAEQIQPQVTEDVEMKEEESHESSDEEAPMCLIDEPLVAQGVGATLKMLQHRGMMADERDDVSYAGRTNDGILKADKDDPAPHLRLDYIDEYGLQIYSRSLIFLGRKLTPKEAFRRISHKFHGKNPGKNKLDKMLRKYEEELKRKKASDTDTPLGSVSAMQKVQQTTKSPFIVLSGPGLRDQLPLGIAVEAAADASAGPKKPKLTLVRDPPKKKRKMR